MQTDTTTKLPDTVSTLPLKDELFLQHYLMHFDAGAAYLHISPDIIPENARKHGSRLLHTPAVQARLRELARQRLDAAEADGDKLIRELSSIAFFDPMQVMTIDDDGYPKLDLKKVKANPGIMRFMDVQFGVSVTKTGKKVHTYTAKPYDRMDAMEKLLKIHQLYKGEDLQKQPLAIQVNVNIPLPGANWRSNPPAPADIVDTEEV